MTEVPKLTHRDLHAQQSSPKNEKTIPVTHAVEDWIGIKQNTPAGPVYNWLYDQLYLTILNNEWNNVDEALTLQVPVRFKSLIPQTPTERMMDEAEKSEWTDRDIESLVEWCNSTKDEN